MAIDDVFEVLQVEAELDALSSPTASQVYRNTFGYSADAVAAVAATRGTTGSASGLGMFNVKDYGAVGNGVANDHAAFIAADAAAAVTGGIVWCPPGVYLIDRVIISPGVSIQGSGTAQNPAEAATVLRARIAAGGISWFSDGGYHGNFFLDGSTAGTYATRLATTPFRRIGDCSGATFFNIDIRYSAGVGMVINKAQNDCYIGVQSQNHQTDGLELNAGCGGLLFLRCEFNENHRYQMLIDDSVAGSGYVEPTQITFDTCLFERGDHAGPTVFQSGSRDITCRKCVFQMSHASYAGAIWEQEDGNFSVQETTWDGCQWFGGNQSGLSAIHFGSVAVGALVCGAQYYNSVSAAFDVPLAQRVLIMGKVRLASGVSRYSAATVASGICNLSVNENDPLQPDRYIQIVRTGATNPAFRTSLQGVGDTFARWEVDMSGRTGWGSGAAAQDTFVSRLGANILGTEAGDKLVANGGLGVGNSAAATTPGTVTKKIEVFDASGASLGFVAVYDAIT